jgi:hypothetical protein
MDEIAPLVTKNAKLGARDLLTSRRFPGDEFVLFGLVRGEGPAVYDFDDLGFV